MPDLSGLTQLSGADFTDNQFSGSIPALSNLPELSYLNLSSNNLSGSLPESLALLPSLNTLIVDSNEIAGVLTQVFASSSIKGIVFDTSSICIERKMVADWLDALEAPVTDYIYCWNLTTATGEELLAAGDTLRLFYRIQNQKFTDPLAMELYMSLLHPDQQTEIFLVIQDSGIQTVTGGADPSTWTPATTDFQLDPGFDSGLKPVYDYALSNEDPAGIGGHHQPSQGTHPSEAQDHEQQHRPRDIPAIGFPGKGMNKELRHRERRN